ncbi:MAG: hypothetical protein QGI09_04425, partial [Dehalococcoidia bacterium]|nr:hypothetical protein [Dehalococcoidia bacterium]
MLKRSIQRFLSSWGFWSVGALAMAAAVFGVLLGPNAVLQGIDFSYGSVIQRASGMPESFLGAWHSRGLLGGAGSTSLTAMNLLLWLLPEELLGNWMYALWLVVASVFLCAFLRLRGCSRVSCLVSSAAFWTGTNLTLVYAGHMQKFGVVALCMVALYCLEKSVRSCSWRWAVLAGGALGAMFLEQQDVALFMGLFVGAYALFAVWREALDPSRDKRNTWGRFVQRLGVCLGPVLVVSLLLVGPTIRSTYRTKVSDTTSVGKGAGTEQKWDFCTQWSLPPEETLDLIVPNFFGIRTGEPKGPYWGRTGQSAGWSEKQAGLRNLRYEGIYVGVVPVLLGLLALAIVCTGRSELPSREETPVSCDKVSVEADARRSDTFFWFGVLSVSLLLSWGRFFPLYRLFWQLPMINAIRNPNKHLHILQVAVGILAAFGLDALLRGVWQSRKGGRRVVWAGVIASVGLAATLAVAMVL